MNDFNVVEFLSEPTPLFPELLALPVEDVVQISQRLDQLTIKMNTFNIKLEPETLKRQRLRRSLNQSKTEILVLNQALTHQNYENIVLREQMATLPSTVFSEIACLTQRTHTEVWCGSLASAEIESRS